MSDRKNTPSLETLFAQAAGAIDPQTGEVLEGGGRRSGLVALGMLSGVFAFGGCSVGPVRPSLWAAGLFRSTPVTRSKFLPALRLRRQQSWETRDSPPQSSTTSALRSAGDAEYA